MQIRINDQRQWGLIKLKRIFSQFIYTRDGKRRPAFILALIFCILISLFAFANFTAGVIAQRNYGVSNMIFKPLILDNYDIFVRKFYSIFVQPQI